MSLPYPLHVSSPPPPCLFPTFLPHPLHVSSPPPPCLFARSRPLFQFALSPTRESVHRLSHMVLSTLLILALHRTLVTRNLKKYALTRHESPSSSVVGTFDWCTGGHGFGSRRGLRFFSLSHARVKLNISSFLFLSELKKRSSFFLY